MFIYLSIALSSYLSVYICLSICLLINLSVYLPIYTSVGLPVFAIYLSISVIQPMQKVQNTAARLILRAPRHQNCTPLLQQLHWLPISERIKYKTACMCYNAITGSAPPYLPALSALRQTHACSNSNASTAKPMAFALFHTLASTSGTIFPKTSGTLLLSLPSKANSRHFSSQNISAKQHCLSPL